MEHRKQPVPQEIALASDVFDQFCNSSTLKSILGHHRQLCELLRIKPTVFPHFYPKLKAKLRSWKAQALWAKFDKRASHKCYNRGKACPNTRVLIIGAGPCGLRTAIEAQLLGAKVVIVEKRDRISRNNVLHLWPFVIQDLRALGAKKFFGKFCAGAIDHISIRQLQCILLKVALILGVEIHEGVSFERLLPPPDEQSDEKIGWRAEVSPADHPVSQYEFDVLIGADGKRNTLDGFKRKEFRGKLAIAITANFINRRTEAEARVEEISGVAFIFNQKFFKDLYEATGIDLENIVYYKDETHYFVMTAKKHSLIDKGVILQDYADTAKLLAPENVDKDALQRYAREAADFSTEYMLPQLEFAVNHYGQPDVAMFDFTSMFAAENASRVVERHGHRLLQILVGDSLLEPFWPTGSGCARGFLSSLDACWAVKSWGSGQATPLDVLAERESVYRLLGQTTPENLQRDTVSYTLDPHTRYPNLNTRCVLAIQVRGLYDSDDPASVEQCLVSATVQEMPKKRRRKVKDSQVHPDTLLHWLKKQVALYDTVHVEDMTHSFKNGLVLCAIVHRYRPDLLDFHALSPEDVAANNQLAFDTLERELGIPPVMTGQEMEQCDVPDKLTMLSYLSQIYDTFRGEIPHIKHPKLEEPEVKEDHFTPPRIAQLRSLTPTQKVSLLGRITSQHHHARPIQIRKPVGVVSSPVVTAGERKVDSLRRQRKRRSNDKDKIGNMERPANVTDHEARILIEARKGAVDKDLSGRIKTLEEKLKGTAVDKKPKDLRRAIGKIEKTDWNVREIEKKILENKMGCGIKHERPEKVPKWSREQFDDKFQAVKSKLQKKGHDKEMPHKYADIDESFKQFDRKLKEATLVQVGPRGSNKVSAIAEQLSGRNQEPEKPTTQKSNSKPALFLPTQGGSESCHFCGKRVYLMERLSAEGRFFHRGCFRCEYCSTTLRLGNYSFDREGKFGSRFFCTQHFGLQGSQRMKLRRKSDEFISGLDKENIPAKSSPKTPEKAKSLSETMDRMALTELDMLDAKTTPERIEFENLTAAASDVEEAPSEMDEDEWTDRNFGASAVEGSSDSISDLSDSEEEANEVFEEAIEQPLTLDETRRLAETWTRRYSKTPEDKQNGVDKGVRQEGEDEDSESYEYEESDDLSYPEYESDDDESETATEGEDEIRARELRKQEVHLKVPERPKGRQESDTGSDTEVGSDDYTSTESESEEDEEENSATEIETDSEFEHDGTTPTQHDVPSILIDDSNITYRRGRRVPEEPKKVQVRTGHILRPMNGTLLKSPIIQKQAHDGVKLEFSPLQPEAESGKSASLSNLNAGSNVVNNNTTRTPPVVKPTPLINPRRGDYFLNRTHSTEGIASKMSLELKKKYLLGASGLAGSVKKSGSASTLDSKFKSFVDMISEHQKLLNPAPEPSPTMQAFLQGTSRLHASLASNPLSPPSPTILSPPLKLPPSPSQQPALLSCRQKELPLGDGFEHVCGLGKREAEMKISSNKEGADNLAGDKLDISSGVPKSDSIEQASKFSDAEIEKVNSFVEQNVTDADSHKNGHLLPAESKLYVDMEMSKPSITEQQPEEEFECRPRSPVHETSIVVPEVPWKTVGNDASCGIGGSGNGDEDDDDDDDIVTDSLSSSSSASDLEHSESEHKSKPSSFCIIQDRTPPRVEIHNSSGELMTELAEDRPKTDKSSDEMILPQFIEVINSVDPSTEGGKKTADTPVSEHKSSDMTSDRSSTSTPPSTRGGDSESYHNEATLAETELSDWAQDADAVVSEDLEDAEFNIDPRYVTVRRHRKPKTIRKSDSELSKHVRIARSEDFDFDDGPGHICGIDKRVKDEQGPSQDFPSNPASRLFSDMDNIEFMDTGEEESGSDDVLGVANKALLHNSGYVQFVNAIDDEDLSTPVVETPTIAHELLTTSIPPSVVLSECEKDSDSLEALDMLSQVEAMNRELVVASAGEDEESSLQPEGTTTEETTTSEIVTVKDSPVDVPQAETSGRDDVFYTPMQESTKSADETSADPVTPSDDPTGTAYEEYVRRLQGRISPFSNVRDSIDVRKSRRRNKGMHHQPRTQELIAEESEGTSTSRVVGSSFNSPGTSRKLEAILRERSKQKDLIHEMVMDKLLAQKKSPHEKKGKRLSRGPLNSFTQSQNCQPDAGVNYEGLTVGSCKEVPESLGTMKTMTEIGTDKDVIHTSPRGGTTDDSNQGHCVHQDLEVPFADDSTPAGEETEEFYTPMTSFKKQSRYLQLRQRPLSVHALFRSDEHAEGSVSERNSSCLPETPLTNPEAFSLPDIRKALFNTSVEMLKTPVVPARRRKEEAKNALERERAREEARLRAQLKTDEELGLSPEDYIKILRQKVPKRHASDAGSSTKRHGILRSLSEPGEELKISECSSSNMQDEPPPCDSNEHSSSTTPAVSRLSPSPVGTPLPSYQQLQTSSEGTSGVASPSSAPLSKTPFHLEGDLSVSLTQSDGAKDTRRKSKDRERRRSIIQAVSDFFHKKKESSGSSSPPKITMGSSHSAKDKFSRFRLNKHKDKGKSENNSWSDDSDEKAPLMPVDVRSKSVGEERSNNCLGFISTSDTAAPPIPPPPVNYQGGPFPRVSEDSYSEPEEDSRATVLSTPTHDTASVDGVTDSLNRRHSRMNQRMARQAQLKRLRMAQEIQRQLEELEVKQRELEERGVSVEKELRGEGMDAECKEESELLREWFFLVRERTELRHYERELMVRAQEMELEDRHARLRQELEGRMSIDDSSKSSEDVVKEGQILREMLEIVERRDSLIALLEEDRQRYQEEDRDLEAQMLAKGLRLTPLRKESDV
ncbi:protein-methionine sulfoxide oxidase mical3a isoform X4 [Cryptotermes secundus]|uniref:protein-methionine sulfoxide oxidase mical3a isoform X4 n=1 Tax=Cryptotermes secundus TaxID=105785 RepID=UPI000CD7D8EB|nr:protein-methionine sulfoxide oxidase mical3a isoform X4 [Cryptotermes secundus]